MSRRDVAAVGAGVLTGLLVLFVTGPAGLALIAMAGAAVLAVRAHLPRPPAIDAATTGAGTGPPHPHPPPSPAARDERPVRELTDEQLCWAWRSSYAQLHRDPTATATLSALRATYLEELHRRHPAGFDAWISSGARASSNPAPFLKPR